MKKMLSMLLICMLLFMAMPVSVFAEMVDEEVADKMLSEEITVDFQATESNEDNVLWNGLLDSILTTDTGVEESIIAYENYPLLSGVMTMDVGDNRFTEIEPNDRISLADRIYNDDTVSGTLSRTDLIDYYTFTVSETSSVTVISVANKRSLMIGVLDSNEEVVAAASDLGYDDGLYSDALTVTLEPGRYYIVPLDENRSSVTYMFYLDITPLHTHRYTNSLVTDPTCATDGYTTYICSCGDSYQDDFVPATGVHTYQNAQDSTCDVCGFVRTVITEPEVPEGAVAMYRLYSPVSGEHFYTSSAAERDLLVPAGWIYEGLAWYAPATGDPVYRLYSPLSGDHHYTVSMGEVNALEAAGWIYEGVAWYTPEDGLPVYRLYSPYLIRGSHHYTISRAERDVLVDAGWIYEGIGWYALDI